MFITDALALGIVPRWAIVRTIRPQSVAEHSFNVAIIASEILQLNPHLTAGGPICRREQVLWHALTHDCDEAVTGDIPRFAKTLIVKPQREIPQLVKVLPDPMVSMAELKVVKLADRIDAYTFINMNGIGKHAEAVAQRLKYDIQNYVKVDMKELIIDPLPTLNLMHLIEREYGREGATGSREGQGT